MTSTAAKIILKKAFRKETEKYKDRDVAGRYDPYFEYITTPKGKKKKVRKQIPDYIPEHDAKILADVKKTAYRLDCSLFDFMGLRFGWSSVIGLFPEVGDVIDLILALQLYRKIRKVECDLGHLPILMLGWIVLDFLVGLVPIVGDLLDASLKCNSRNVMMLEQRLEEMYAPKMSRAEKRRSRLEPLEDGVSIDQLLGEESPYRNTTGPQVQGVYQETQLPLNAPAPVRGPQVEHPAKSKGWRSWFGGRAPATTNDVESGLRGGQPPNR